MKNLKNIMVYIALLLAFTSISHAADEERNVVRFVYFIEKGESYNQEDYDALKQQAFIFQKYWNEQFGGTFYLTKD